MPVQRFFFAIFYVPRVMLPGSFVDEMDLKKLKGLATCNFDRVAPAAERVRDADGLGLSAFVIFVLHFFPATGSLGS